MLDVLAKATRSLVECDLVEPEATLVREEVYPWARGLDLDLDVAAWMAARAG